MKVQYFEAGLVIFILLIVTALDWVMPVLTRRDLLFGVTVAPNTRETEAGRRIITRYRLSIIILDILVAVGAILLIILTPDNFWKSGYSALVIVVATLLPGLPYLFAHFSSRRLAVAPRPGAEPPPVTIAAPTAELRPRRYGDYVPLIWELLPLAIIGATAAYLATQYASAPAIIATHFDAAGNPNAYHPKTIASYFSIVWSQLGLYILLTLLCVLTAGAKAVPGRAEERFRRIWLRVLFGVKTLLMALFAFLAVAIAQSATSAHFAAGWVLAVSLGATLLIIVVVFAVALRTGQGGSRLDPATAAATDRMNDSYWKLGAIYVNPDDPSLFVERRYGVGWTLNFGNPKAIAVFAGILALPIAISVLTIVFSRVR